MKDIAVGEKRYEVIEFVIEPGEIQVNDGALVVARGKKVIALSIDLKSKYAVVDCTTSSGNVNKAGKHTFTPGIHLGATENTLFIDELRKGNPTQITFPSLKNWRVHSTYIGRYTLDVCLTKEPDYGDV